MKLWHFFNDYYRITDWIAYEGEIAPEVSRKDRRIIKNLGYVAGGLLLVIWILLIVLGVGYVEATL